MTKEEFAEGMKYNYLILDKINIQKYIHQGDSIFNIMDRIEDDAYAKNFSDEILDMINNPIMQGEIFNHIDHNEFMLYLDKRYGTKFVERLDYWVSRTGK